MDSLAHGSCVGLTILIVEDEPLVALDIASTFEEAGASVTTTNTLSHAMLLAEHDGLSAAVIDHALVDGDTAPLRIKLTGLGIPFVLYSGFEQPGELGTGVHLSKPATADSLIATLMALFNVINHKRS